MQLVHFHAFAVSASGWNDVLTIPGGRIAADTNLQSLVASNIEKARFNQCLESLFDTDDQRGNDMRELIRKHAFGDEGTSDGAAKEIAERLCVAMDNRSNSALLVIASQKDGILAQVTLWTFPREEALRLVSQDSASSLQVLNDIFSQSSRLRKAAYFKGGQAKTDFLGGRILDFQSRGGPKSIADFWLSDFLHSVPAISPKEGTKIIAKALIECAKEMANADDVNAQQQLQNAAMTIHSGPKSRWSPSEIAKQFMGEDLQKRFRKKFPNESTFNTSIDIEDDTYTNTICFTIFKLNSGVIVTSPFSEIGDSVKVTTSDGEGSRLICEGRVVSQRMRSPNGIR